MLGNKIRNTGGVPPKLQLPGRVSSEKEQCGCVPVTPRHGREVPAAAFLTKPWAAIPIFVCLTRVFILSSLQFEPQESSPAPQRLQRC